MNRKFAVTFNPITSILVMEESWKKSESMQRPSGPDDPAGGQ
jgi:hypothetical protein